jgi:hypothetical protein
LYWASFSFPSATPWMAASSLLTSTIARLRIDVFDNWFVRIHFWLFFAIF